MSEKTVITAALTGSVPRKEQNPAVPYTPEEVAEESYRCWNEGASVVHLHARDPHTGARAPQASAYRAIADAVRARCPELVINISTSARPGEPEESRIGRVLDSRPEMASLNTNTMNLAYVDHRTGQVQSESVFENTFAQVARYARTMKEIGTKPECELFDFSGLYNVLLIRKQGVFVEPMHFQMVFGVAGGIPFELHHMARLIDLLPEGATWSACGVGRQQFQAVMTAVVAGGHIRVGLEDNLRMPDRSLARGSWEQVRWATQEIRMAGNDVASPDEARSAFHLAARNAGSHS